MPRRRRSFFFNNKHKKLLTNTTDTVKTSRTVATAGLELEGYLDTGGHHIDMGTNNITDTKVGQWDTAYGWGNHASAGYSTTTYSNSDVDSHLNQSNPTSGYVLSWNGSDYAWVEQSGGVTSYNDLTDKPTIPTNNNQLTNGAGYTTTTAQELSRTGLGSSDDLGSGSSAPLSAGWYSWGNAQPSNSPDNYALMFQLNDGGQPQQWVMAYGGSANSVDLYARRRTGGTWDTTWTKFWSTANDGSGSGLDADTVDGIQAANFLRSDTTDTTSGDLQVDGDLQSKSQIRAQGWWNTSTGSYGDAAVEIGMSAGTGYILCYDRNTSSYGNLVIQPASINLAPASNGAVNIKGYTAWHAGNDGSGSGLDADTLDGQHGSYYQPRTLQQSSRNLVFATGSTGSGGIFLEASNGSPRIQLYGDGTNYGFLWGEWGGWDIKKADGGPLYIDIGGTLREVYHTGNLPTIPTNNNQLTNGAGYITNGANYNVNNVWLRENGDNAHVQLYGNSRQMVFRTDGTTEYSSGVGGYAFAWMYGGNSSGNRRMLLDSNGSLWTNSQGTLFGTSNDGSGSGLDADTVDGVQASSFMRSDGNTSTTGTIFAAGNAFYAQSSNNKVKYAMWGNGDTTYGVGMRSGFTYGHLSDYALTFQMSNTNNRGFWWGDTGHSLAQGAMSLTTTGYLTVATALNVGQGESVTSPSTATFYSAGNSEIAGELNVSRNTGSSTPSYSQGMIEVQTSDNSAPAIGFHRGGYSATTLYESNGELYANAWVARSQTGKLLSTGNIGETAFTQTGTRTMNGYYVGGADGHRDKGIYGNYNSYRINNIWSMGTGYRVSSAGTGFGNLYGMAYTYNNRVYTSNAMGTNHQMVWCINGTPKCALGANIWTAGNVTAYSDIRVKENLEIIPDALEKVKKLNGYTFDRTDIVTDNEGNTPRKRQTGVVAQEVLEVLPEVVTGNEDNPDGQLSVAYGNMVGLLIEAIKEQQEQIEELKARLQ